MHSSIINIHYCQKQNRDPKKGSDSKIGNEMKYDFGKLTGNISTSSLTQKEQTRLNLGTSWPSLSKDEHVFFG